MAVGAVGTTSRSSGAPAAAPKAATTDASLTADADGNLTLTPPPGKMPINISKGDEGRYHLSVGNQDIAFTPEQMKRLDIKATADNPIRMDANVDLALKVNGQAHERGPDGMAQKARGRGFESIPEVAGDAYAAPAAQAAQQKGAQRTPGLKAAQQVDAAQNTDASRAVRGNNWDSVGVPGRTREASAADRAERAQDAARAGDKAPPDVKKADEKRTDEKKTEEQKKPEEKKKPKEVQFVQVLDPGGGEGVDVKTMGDVIRVEEKVSIDRWKKFFANMAGGGGASGLDDGGMLNAAATEVAGVRAQAMEAQLAARALSQAADPSRVPVTQDTVATDNNTARQR